MTSDQTLPKAAPTSGLPRGLPGLVLDTLFRTALFFPGAALLGTALHGGLQGHDPVLVGASLLGAALLLYAATHQHMDNSYELSVEMTAEVLGEGAVAVAAEATEGIIGRSVRAVLDNVEVLPEFDGPGEALMGILFAAGSLLMLAIVLPPLILAVLPLVLFLMAPGWLRLGLVLVLPASMIPLFAIHRFFLTRKRMKRRDATPPRRVTA